MSFYVIKAYLLHAERYAFAFIIQCELIPECYKVLITNALSYMLKMEDFKAGDVFYFRDGLSAHVKGSDFRKLLHPFILLYVS